MTTQATKTITVSNNTMHKNFCTKNVRKKKQCAVLIGFAVTILIFILLLHHDQAMVFFELQIALIKIKQQMHSSLMRHVRHVTRTFTRTHRFYSKCV